MKYSLFVLHTKYQQQQHKFTRDMSNKVNIKRKKVNKSNKTAFLLYFLELFKFALNISSNISSNNSPIFFKYLSEFYLAALLLSLKGFKQLRNSLFECLNVWNMLQMEFVRLLTENSIKRQNVNNAFISSASACSQWLVHALLLVWNLFAAFMVSELFEISEF